MKHFTTCSTRRNRTNKRRGVVLIEFCIAFFCVFAPLCMALLQYGMILQTTLAMNNLSREAGRFASIKARTATDDTELRNYITTNATGLGVTIKNPTTDIIVDKPVNTLLVQTNRVQYAPIKIDITYDMGQKVFFTSIFHIPIFKSTYSTSVVMIMQ